MLNNTYAKNRVFPRDLFNDGNLLKCAAQLFLLEVNLKLPENVTVTCPSDYRIFQNEYSGATYIQGLRLTTEKTIFTFERPLNSREHFPLYAYDMTEDDPEGIEVFKDNGTLTEEFSLAIKG